MSWKKTQKKSWEMFLVIKVTCTIHNHLKFASCALTESLHVVDKCDFLMTVKLVSKSSEVCPWHRENVILPTLIPFCSQGKSNHQMHSHCKPKVNTLVNQSNMSANWFFSNVLGLCYIIWPSLLRVVRIGWQFDQDKVNHVLKHGISTPYKFFPSGSAKSPLSGVSRSAYVFK